MRPHAEWNVAFVGMSSPAHAEAFRQKLESPHVFLCDPDKALYRGFGLTAGKLSQMFNMNTLVAGARAAAKGHGIGAPVGDPMQMPGAFVIGIDGEVTWEHRSRDAADNPTPEQIGEALDAARR